MKKEEEEKQKHDDDDKTPMECNMDDEDTNKGHDDMKRNCNAGLHCFEENFIDDRDIAIKACCDVEMQKKNGNMRKCKEDERVKLLLEAKKLTNQGECCCAFKKNHLKIK